MKDPNSTHPLLSLNMDGLGFSVSTPNTAKSWSQNPTKQQQAFQAKVGNDKFNQANDLYNQKYDQWQKTNMQTDFYKNLPDQAKKDYLSAAKQKIEDNVMKQYGFNPSQTQKTQPNQQQKEQKNLIQEAIKKISDAIVPPAYAADENSLLGSDTTISNKQTGQTTTEHNAGLLEQGAREAGSLL